MVKFFASLHSSDSGLPYIIFKRTGMEKSLGFGSETIEWTRSRQTKGLKLFVPHLCLYFQVRYILKVVNYRPPGSKLNDPRI